MEKFKGIWKSDNNKNPNNNNVCSRPLHGPNIQVPLIFSLF